jgi:YidC/Oxa1 family membrane protein insertase
MDKQTTIGFVLIGLVLVVWMWLQAPPTSQQHPAGGDTTHAVAPPARDTLRPEKRTAPVLPAASAASLEPGKFFAKAATGMEKVLIIKTDLYTAELTTKGGLVRKWELRNYLTWDKHPVQLVDFDRGGDFSLLFTSSDGKLIDTRNLYFQTDRPAWETVQLTGDRSYTVDLALPAEGGGRIIKRFTFTNGKYSFDAEIDFRNVGDVISNFEYQIVWENGLRYAEQNSFDESSFAMAYAYSGGEMTEIDATNANETVKQDINGATSWVATRNKYFALAMMAEEGKSQGAYLEGVHLPMPDKGVKENYVLALKMPFRGSSAEAARLTVYCGPIDYDVVKGYQRGLEKTMTLGAAWIIRPISEYVMIPLFQFLRMFIPNYGWVIIVFSIIIKIALHPLTRTSMKSMKKMQALTPLMNAIREKYKDDPQKMNQQVMNLYKEYGVNPAAGCLPMLLQMPILFALYSVFRSSIELRQASFFGWIHDLSIPDTIVDLPFTVPFFGMNQVSGLALAMGVTMFIQQKMSTTDPRQKSMVYIMPVMMTLIFASLPSGLNLYYFVFNLLSIGQQIWINKQHGDEPPRKVEQKKKTGGILARITKDLPKLR